MNDDDPYDPKDPLLAILKDRGVQLDEPRAIVHFFYCKDADTVNRLSKEILKMGLELGNCDFEDDEYIDEGEYVLTVKEVAKPNQMSARKEEFEAFGEKFGCSYDGWETAV